MIKLDTKRHDALFDKSKCTFPIHVIGLGGVGSHVTQELAKLGVGTNESNTVDLYDGDLIEAHNISNQAYGLRDIGEYKVDALARQFGLWSGGNPATAHREFVTNPRPLSGVVFLCVDSNDTRKKICYASIFNNPEVSLLIDTRMDAKNAVVFTIDPNNIDHVDLWNEYWFPDTESENFATCDGPLSVITAVTITASIAVQQFIDFAKAQDHFEMKNHIRITLGEWEIKSAVW